GLGGGLISAVDLLKGIAVLIGLEPISVPGATGYYDTNYAGKGQAALACLARERFAAVHIEATDEAGHNGHAAEKVRALENIDRHILAPLVAEAERSRDLRILYLPDHPTPLRVRNHTADPVPFVIWGAGINAKGAPRFTEAEIAQRSNSAMPAADLLRRMIEA
ncbi:MAG: phosphoglycerate mutase, partial [Planctomycetota bacterium]|nr:phosphoglycerate mutase [Planctomycetota bacterium]